MPRVYHIEQESHVQLGPLHKTNLAQVLSYFNFNLALIILFRIKISSHLLEKPETSISPHIM